MKRKRKRDEKSLCSLAGRGMATTDSRGEAGKARNLTTGQQILIFAAISQRGELLPGEMASWLSLKITLYESRPLFRPSFRIPESFPDRIPALSFLSQTHNPYPMETRENPFRSLAR